MTSVYFSAVLSQPAEKVWAVDRDFGDYRLFTSGRGEVHMEENS